MSFDNNRDFGAKLSPCVRSPRSSVQSYKYIYTLPDLTPRQEINTISPTDFTNLLKYLVSKYLPNAFQYHLGYYK